MITSLNPELSYIVFYTIMFNKPDNQILFWHKGKKVLSSDFEIAPSFENYKTFRQTNKNVLKATLNHMKERNRFQFYWLLILSDQLFSLLYLVSSSTTLIFFIVCLFSLWDPSGFLHSPCHFLYGFCPSHFLSLYFHIRRNAAKIITHVLNFQRHL